MNTVRRRLPSASLGHAARVAAAASAVIAAVYLVAVTALNFAVLHRLYRQVDQRLAGVLADVSRGQENLSDRVHPFSRDLDDSPVLIWRVGVHGAASAVTLGAPRLPVRSWSAGAAVTALVGGSQVRLEAAPYRGGWVVAGESLAQQNHFRTLLLVGEAVVAPVVLLAVYLGSLTIGLKASAPVERTRRRQLEFTADASHELRTPLSVIEAEVDLALSSARDAAYYRSALERVAGESDRLKRIVEDMLWLARFDAQPPPPGHEPVDLVPIARHCAERFAVLAANAGIEIVLDAEDGAPVLVKAPPEWVDRLLGVLVDNACRYSPAGSRVTVSVATSGGRSRVVVEDQGPGIPPEERDRLFDRFHRASDEPGGAGLGLAIADSVVRSTGGRWKIGDAAAGGARMEVSWNRVALPDRREPSRLPEPARS
ncbi:MAG TPA: HAMP domain-containing sensor histidine kinase [Acidimicrobiales bacterium]|nr:HAMP domain-containing sensor histidine kinase [Acidimicrobiales bacterium]